MTMKREQFKQAFRDAAAIEFKDVPLRDSDIDYVFSVRFETKMRKLIKHQKNSLWYLVNTAGKRVAVVFVALLMLTATACSFPKVRAAIVELVTKVYDKYVDYSFEGETTDEIMYTYYLSPIPSGFIETDNYSDDNIKEKEYTNSNNDIIRFSQTITEGATFVLDNEQGDTKEINVSGKVIHLYSSDGIYNAVWTENGMLLRFIIYGNYDESFVISLIESVKYS